MKIIFLGTGTSTGVPEIGCQCKVCTSKDKRDWRLRTSAVIEIEGKRILIDCGPDFRWQVIKNKIYRLDGVLITHEHYDHVGGLDDLRPFCRFKDIPVYADSYTAGHLMKRMDYCFAERLYPGVPALALHKVDVSRPFFVEGVEVVPVQVMHGRMPILGYRIGKMAYLTDMSHLPDAEYAKLKGLDCLLMNALRIKPHPTHQSLDEALRNAACIGAKDTYFIHMSHHIGLHAETGKRLPPHVHFSYDGMVVELS